MFSIHFFLHYKLTSLFNKNYFLNIFSCKFIIIQHVHVLISIKALHKNNINLERHNLFTNVITLKCIPIKSSE